MITESLDFWRYICNCLLIFQNGVFDLNFYGINNPLWYLSVLLVLYIIYYFEQLIFKKTKININYIYVFVLLLYIAVSRFNINIPFFNWRIVRGIIPFNVGCILATINEKIKNTRIDIFSFITLVIIAIIFVFKKDIILSNLQRILIYVIYPLLVLFCLNSKILNRILDHKVVGELGKISFETYIWHLPIFNIITVINNFFNIFPTQERWFMFLFALIVILWSSIIHYFVEKPITSKLLSIFNKKVS